MTEFLSKAFDEASKLPEELQDQLAARLLRELADEVKWDGSLADSAEALEQLADQALREHDERKTTEYMSNEVIFTVQESPEGGYEAQALSAPIFTEADTLEDLRSMVRDAVECHFEDADRPKVIRLHFVKDEVMAV